MKALVMAMEILLGSNGERAAAAADDTETGLGCPAPKQAAEQAVGRWVGGCAAMEELLGPESVAKKQRPWSSRASRTKNHCHLASPRRRQRMFPWQVFGLSGSSLLAGLPNLRDPVSCLAFVPDYRCGAVPDSHRIPFCTHSSWLRDRGIDSLYTHSRADAYKILWISCRAMAGDFFDER